MEKIAVTSPTQTSRVLLVQPIDTLHGSQFQHKLKSSQKDKVRQFIAFTQTGEKSAINCLGHHDWKLDVAVDNFFQNPERYNKEPKLAVDRRKVEQLFNKYKGMSRYFGGFAHLMAKDADLGWGGQNSPDLVF